MQGKNLGATIKMTVWRKPRVTVPSKPRVPPKPPSPPPKPKPTVPHHDAPDVPTKPRSSGFSPAGMVGGLATAGLGLAPMLLGSNPLRLAGGLADALGLDDLADNITDFLGDITGFNYLKEHPLVAVGIAGGVGFVGLKFLRVL